MFVAPGEALKTTLLNTVEDYRGTLILSDVDVGQLKRLRGDMICGKISTLVFSEYQKIVERHPAVGRNIESTLKAMVAEGFRGLEFGSDARASAFPARCTIIGAITTEFYEKNYLRWREDQFLRRFIWAKYVMEEPYILTDAARQNIRIELNGNGLLKEPADRHIPYTTTNEEGLAIEKFMKRQLHTIPIRLMCKALSALRWSDKRSKLPEDYAWKTVREFCQSCFDKDGMGKLEL